MNSQLNNFPIRFRVPEEFPDTAVRDHFHGSVSTDLGYAISEITARIKTAYIQRLEEEFKSPWTFDFVVTQESDGLDFWCRLSSKTKTKQGAIHDHLGSLQLKANRVYLVDE